MFAIATPYAVYLSTQVWHTLPKPNYYNYNKITFVWAQLRGKIYYLAMYWADSNIQYVVFTTVYRCKNRVFKTENMQVFIVRLKFRCICGVN